MSDFLLELRSEEIPARMQARAREDLARLFADEIGKAGLAAESVTCFSTPRRLALMARGLADGTPPSSEETKGPKATAPEQAIEGFLRKTGLTRDQLVERDGTLFAVVERPGRSTADVLADTIPAIIRAFPWPKSMRWGASSTTTTSLRWVRPLEGVVALLGNEVVSFVIDGIRSSAETRGHRFHAPGPVIVASAEAYAASLRAAHVIVDQAEREAIIRDGAATLAQGAGFALVEDEALVVENAGLTEWPVPLLGRFDPAFLEVPEEVIQLTARINQKYFVMRDGAGKLAPAFICTANIAASDRGTAVVAGNERVLAARLSDARFFWEQDLNVPLEAQAARLSDIVFHEKLGTVADKVERVAALTRWLCAEGIIQADPDLAERAARLAKADLVTGMVGEFPELQGVIGGYLATAQGEPVEVVEAVRDHYKPVGQGDAAPTAPVTVAVSLADKLDTLTAFFGADMRPSGSKDPFALRRAGIAILALQQGNAVRVGLSRIAGVDADVIAFLTDRLKVQQREAGVRHDLIDAVVASGAEDDFVRLLARVTALQALLDSEAGRDLLTGYKRAANILKKESPGDAPADASTYVPEAAERVLIDAVAQVAPQVDSAVEAEDFEGAMRALARLRGPIDAFFSDVTVNDSDPAKRNARLQLLARFRDAVHTVADFSKIEG